MLDRRNERDIFREKYSLTDREIDVARYVVSGLPYRQIANSLFLSLYTVKTHVSTVFRKLGIHSREELVLLYPNNAFGKDLEVPINLTSRECEIGELISRGMTNREIADALFISENTVKTHITNLLGKMPNGSGRVYVMNVFREHIEEQDIA